MLYKLQRSGEVVCLANGATIPANPKNRDWQKYQRWLAEGNRPEPADPPPTPEPPKPDIAQAIADATDFADLKRRLGA